MGWRGVVVKCNLGWGFWERFLGGLGGVLDGGVGMVLGWL